RLNTCSSQVMTKTQVEVDAVVDRPLVLIVEDYDDSREMYAELLELHGFRVAQAADGQDAVDKAIALIPDVIVMDLSLPRPDGRGGAGVGIGVQFFEPAGLTLEAWLTYNTAIDVAFGWNRYDERSLYGHVQFIVAPFNLSPRGSVSLPFYLGLGGEVFDGGTD